MILIFLCKGDAYVHSTAKDSREHRSKNKGEDAVKCLCTRHKLAIRQTENDPRFNQNDHEFRKWLCCWQDDSALIYKVWGESLNGLIRNWCEVFYITKQPSQLPSRSWTPKGGFGQTALSTIILKRPRIRRKVFLPPKRTRRDTLLFLYHVMFQLRQCCCFFVFPLCNLLPVHIKARCVHILFSPLLGHHVL